jgi:multiple sugar transport system ATP-binding protein
MPERTWYEHMIQIELSHVAKSYGSVEVLNDVSLQVEDGEFVVLVGPSGCGKSTLLRMIAGLEDVTSGDIFIGGKDARKISAKDRDLAMVFQSYALYPHMNVSRNMSFALKLARVSKAEIDRRVSEAAKILGLESLLDRLPRELSGGQRQRVAMGRAIVRDPIAFLFDEPLSNLDARLRIQMRSEIKKLHQRLGRAIVYVTHDQTEAMTMADKVVVLNGGQVAQMGKPQDLYQNPQTEFVASFIGSPEINLIPAFSAGADADFVRVGEGMEMPIKKPLDVPEGTPVTYGIRPQHMLPVEDGIAAKVVLVEPTGEDLEVTIDLDGQDRLVVIRDMPDLKTGDTVHLLPDVNKVLLFNSASGNRINPTL